MARSTGAEMLRISDSAARARAADALAAGEIAVIAFNGIFVLVGDADDPAVPDKIAAAKHRPRDKGVALVCPPEFVSEHVASDSRAMASRLATVRTLYGRVHALGVILPARAGAPAHVVQAGTILNVWTEERPVSPLRQLVLELRRRGRRALAGTSANETGRPTISDPVEVRSVFGARVSLLLLDEFDAVPPTRRRSASIVDWTRAIPRLVREGSVAEAELRRELSRLGLSEFAVARDVRRV
jgi:tRNA A37 threonylcarbamoyladenosine synthetase subunit TsaC/SUA5/YrdC